MNQSGQIGYQLGREDKPLEVVIKPAVIELPLGKEETVEKLACGRAHSLVLTNTGSVLSLGDNAYGQCGRPVIEEEDYFNNQVAGGMLALFMRPITRLLKKSSLDTFFKFLDNLSSSWTLFLRF